MEYYPELKVILERLGEDCILVGSATTKDPETCKDFDFVINANGWNTLKDYEYYLFAEDINWKQYIPVDAKDKCVDFFYGICNILDVGKHDKRITYDDACLRELKIVEIGGVPVLSI